MATRPCACGWLGDPSGKCRCTPDQVLRYRARISGPLLDRIDLQLFVPRLDVAVLRGSGPPPESSATVRERVTAAHERALSRQGKPNALLTSRELERDGAVTPAARSLLDQAAAKLSLSARSFQRVLKVARSIADLGQSAEITGAHVAEAVQLRQLDRL